MRKFETMEKTDLKKLRLSQGETLESLANKLDVSKQAVNSHEVGYNNGEGIRVNTLREHLTALGISLALVITLPDGTVMELASMGK